MGGIFTWYQKTAGPMALAGYSYSDGERKKKMREFWFGGKGTEPGPQIVPWLSSNFFFFFFFSLFHRCLDRLLPSMIFKLFVSGSLLPNA